jgi:hypothetical protein
VTIIHRVAWLAVLLAAATTFSAGQSSAAFFGMHVNNHKDFGVWPDIPFSSIRLHDSGVGWREIEVAPGRYDWNLFDHQLKRAKEHNVEAFYDFVRTPEFYTSHSQCAQDFRGGNCDPDRCAKYGGKNQNGCFPPNDLNRDGSGSDEHFKTFVNAVVDHVAALGTSNYAAITVWETWNEFDRETFWQGTNPQLLRMSKDMRAIVKAKFPDAVVTTPNSTLPRILREYLQQPGAPEAADAISLHSYLGHCDPEEELEKRFQNYQRLRNDFMPGKPFYVTEGSWGKPENCSDPDAQAAFTARYLLLMMSGIGDFRGVDRLWWYAYDVPTGRLNDPDTGAIMPAGVAYREVFHWVTENQLVPHSCKHESGTRWSCALKKQDGTQAMIVWDADPGRMCGGGNCPTAGFGAPGKFKRYRDLTGKRSSLDGQAPIGAKPILLEEGRDTN